MLFKSNIVHQTIGVEGATFEPDNIGAGQLTQSVRLSVDNAACVRHLKCYRDGLLLAEFRQTIFLETDIRVIVSVPQLRKRRAWLAIAITRGSTA